MSISAVVVALFCGYRFRALDGYLLAAERHREMTVERVPLVYAADGKRVRFGEIQQHLERIGREVIPIDAMRIVAQPRDLQKPIAVRVLVIDERLPNIAV